VNHVRSWPRVIEEAMETTVFVETVDKDGEVLFYGTGFVLSSDGQIVTNFHVIFPEMIEEGVQVWVEFKNRKRYLVQKTYSYPLHDIVILKINASNLPFVRREARRELREGDPIVVAGSRRYELIFSEGMVSAMYRRPGGLFWRYKWVETTVLIYPGFSGGPVFNRYGNVVGINNATFPDRPGFAMIIPVKYLEEVIEMGLYEDTLDKLSKINEIYDELHN
jgi:serine protease Do